MSDERREVRAKVRSYIDKETKEEKNVYSTIGAAWVSEHGSKIGVTLDTVPVNWDGTFFINKPYEPKDGKELTHEFNKKVTDNLPTDEDMDKPINLSEIPF